MRRYIGSLIAVILAALAILFFRSGDPTPGAVAALEDTPRYTLRGAQWRRFDLQGQMEFEGRARTIDYFDDESARLSQVELTALTGSGSPWTASAPEGRAPAGERRVQLRGGVTGQGRWPDGEALEFTSPELWLDSAKQELTTDAAVQIESRSKQVAARGLRVRGKKQQVMLLQDVKMRYVPRP
ncbi:MAG: LPS export ABC transporter periplasmic protein LptC [Panacagrimonas sp.]